MIFLNLCLSLGGTLCLYYIVKLFYLRFMSPIRHLPGPEGTSFIYGNLREIRAAESSTLYAKWIAESGSTTIKYKGLFNINQLLTLDTKAVNHILVNTQDYQKPETTRFNLSRMIGPGVLVVEGDKHRQQRKIMNPAFGPVQIRALTSVFVAKAIQLRDILASEISEKASAGGSARIDIISWLSRMTLDVIGLAGFNYKFESLSVEEKPDELHRAFDTLFRASGISLVQILLLSFFRNGYRVLSLVVPSDHETKRKQAQQTMSRIGIQLLRDSKAAVMAEKDGFITKDSLQGRDLLSLLIKANMATDIPDNQRLSDDDVLAQVPTFLVAGHETTSTATTWALYALTQNSAAQIKLRDELFSVSTDHPTMDQLNALPYLDRIVRETLRLHAPVPTTIRIAMKDDVIPLNIPFVDKLGRTQDHIRIRKGQIIVIPILAMNKAKHLWGEDALEFIPERWESLPEAVTSIPGVWGNMMSFLGGSRACIGYRFSLVEMKALLFTLVRAFEFELAVPAQDIGRRTTIVQRPFLLTDSRARSQMPLLIKPYQA